MTGWRTRRGTASTSTSAARNLPPDKRLIELACKDVSKALLERTTVLDGNSDELRQLMVERLERLFFTVYRAAIRSGDASYRSDVADDHSRWIRDAILNYSPQLGISLRPGSSAANRFDLTRIEPGGSVILIQTRWDEDDLAGRVLADEGDRWTVIDLPALALAEDDALGRPLGAPLWPEHYDHDALAEIRRSVGERVWWSLYMQQPRPQDGGVWEWVWITNNRISAARFRGLDLTRIVVAVDPAGRESAVGDETGIVATATVQDGHLYVLDDRSGNRGADAWGREACLLASELRADAIVVESNYGGDMSKQILNQAWQELHREGRTMDSPDRMDAAVHAMTQLADPQHSGVTSSAYRDGRLSGRR
ncbi:hypothetical protein [Streptomyces sp. NPDC054863]